MGGIRRIFMNLCELKKPFPSKDIEWRVTRSGVKKNGEPWALVTAYVTNRAIMDRLDEVCGPANWQNRFTEGPNGGQLCGISVRVGDEWIMKWDGADNTQIEAVKGGLSGAMKRAAVQWGIGRYLYSVEEGYAQVFTDESSTKGIYRGEAKRKDNTRVYFTWNPPKLPAWALPSDDDGKGAAPVTDSAPQNGGNQDKKVNKKQFDDVLSECKKHGADSAALFKHFGVKRGSELRESQLHEVYDWILAAGKE